MNLLLDYLDYVSYKQQRDAGATAEMCAGWYARAYLLEQRYKLEQKQIKN